MRIMWMAVVGMSLLVALTYYHESLWVHHGADKPMQTVLERVPAGLPPAWCTDARQDRRPGPPLDAVGYADACATIEESVDQAEMNGRARLSRKVKEALAADFSRQLAGIGADETTRAYLSGAFVAAIGRIGIQGMVREQAYSEKISERLAGTEWAYCRSYALVALSGRDYASACRLVLSSVRAMPGTGKVPARIIDGMARSLTASRPQSAVSRRLDIRRRQKLD